jgi:hypothetical protein
MTGSSTFGHHGKRGPLSYRQMALRRRIFTTKRPAEQVNLIGQDANVIRIARLMAR